MCQSLGKFPHEFGECTQEEIAYMTAAWNGIHAEGKGGK
jgi:hypothetical protein